MTERLYRSTINALAGTVGYLIPMLVNLIATPILLRKLGSEAFGLQSMVAVVVGYMTVMDMGLDLPIIKLLAEDRAKKDICAENRMLGGTLQLYAMIGVVGMLAIWILAPWLAKSVFKVSPEYIQQAIWVFRISGVGFLGSVGMSWGRALAVGLQRFEIGNGVSAASTLLGVGTGIGFVLAGYGVIGFVAARSVVSLCSGPVYYFAAKCLLPEFRIRLGVDKDTLVRVRGYIGYGVINRIMGGLLGRIDQTLIAMVVGVSAAGIFSVPFLVINTVRYLINNMVGFIFPMASELHTVGDMERLASIFRRAVWFVSAVTGLAFLPLLVFGDKILDLWVPSIAKEGAVILLILAIASYFTTIFTALTNGIVIGTGHMRAFTTYSVTRNLIFLAACYLMVDSAGMVGAALAHLVTVVIDFIYIAICIKRYLGRSLTYIFGRRFFYNLLWIFGLVACGLVIRRYIGTWITLIGGTIFLEFVGIVVGLWLGVFAETERKAILGLVSLGRRKLAEWNSRK